MVFLQAVTAGIHVKVGCVFAPGLSSPEEELCHTSDRVHENLPGYRWCYQIQMWADEAAPPQGYLLRNRHWEIRDSGGHVDVVDGEGVVGEYPLLMPGTPPESAPFTYASSTSLHTASGTMNGWFEFVVPQITADGVHALATLQATVATWDLQVPEYIYG